CGGSFINHSHQPTGSFICSLCQPPSRAVKKRRTVALSSQQPENAE
ncbi:FlhC family transcriptional regulator, partial [Erwinia sp. MYb416]